MSTLKTAFSTGPGLFAVRTSSSDPSIGSETVRLFTARIEAYDGPRAKNTDFDEMVFTLLPAMAVGKPDVARAMIELHATLTANMGVLLAEARKS